MGPGIVAACPANRCLRLIKKVRTSEFDGYIKNLSDVFDKYQYSRAIGIPAATEGAPRLTASADDNAESLASLLELTSHLLEDPIRKKTQGKRGKMLSINAPPLTTVPATFLEPSFNLGNPTTFAEVCENADFSKLATADAQLTNNLLQDKLSLFLDTVEVHLVREISRRSTSFFSALGALQALHHETQLCVDQIHELRERLSRISTTGVKRALDVGRLHSRKGNLVKLCDGVQKIATIQQTKPTIEALLEKGEYVATLDMVQETMSELSGFNASYGTSDSGLGKANMLTDVRGVKHLSGQLQELSSKIGSMMELDLVNVLLANLRDAVKSIDAAGNVAPILHGTKVALHVKNMYKIKSGSPPVPVAPSSTSSVPLDHVDRQLLQRLQPLVSGLLRIDKLGNAIQSFKEAVASEVKTVTKSLYPSVVVVSEESPVTAGSPQSPTKREQSLVEKKLRTMTFDSFFELTLSIYTALMHIMQRVVAFNEIIVTLINQANESGLTIGSNAMYVRSSDSNEAKDVLVVSKKNAFHDDDEDAGSDVESDVKKAGASLLLENESPMGEREQIASSYGQTLSDANDLLNVVGDKINKRCVKLVGVRSDQNAQLNPKDFYRLFSATMEFVQCGESSCGRLSFGLGLKLAIGSQAKAFLNHFHEERSKQIAMLVENEQWIKAEVPMDFQVILDEIVTAASKTAPEQTISHDHMGSEDEENNDGDLGNAPASGSNESVTKAASDIRAKSARYLIVDGQKFYVAGCVLMFSKMLSDYLHCIENVPTIATDVLNKVVDVLK
ncbi:hypothetical protein HK101_001317, partial [Irineochytrium annulatum]